MSATRCDHTAAWAELTRLKQTHHVDLRQAFAADSQRFARFSWQAPYVLADLSKNLIDIEIFQALTRLAEQSGLAEQRAAMFRGELINRSEGRAVMHWLLRQPDAMLAEPVATEFVAKEAAEVLRTRRAMLASNQPAVDLAESEGPVWDTEALQRDFEVLGFMAPYVVARRRSDNVLGSLEFTGSPRVFFNWAEDR